MITKNDINTTITCDKCQKQQSASNQNYNKIFWIYKWVLNGGRKYERLCYDCAPNKIKKAIDSMQNRGL